MGPDLTNLVSYPTNPNKIKGGAGSDPKKIRYNCQLLSEVRHHRTVFLRYRQPRDPYLRRDSVPKSADGHGRGDAPVAKRSGWVSAKRELRSSRKAPRPCANCASCALVGRTFLNSSGAMGSSRPTAKLTNSQTIKLTLLANFSCAWEVSKFYSWTV